MKDNENNRNRPYGQPYYDENGKFHSGFKEESTDKHYEEEYRRQMEEYERLSGENSEDFDETLEFIPYEDRYRYAQQNNPRNNSNQNRQKNSGQNKSQNSRNNQQRKKSSQGSSSGKKKKSSNGNHKKSGNSTKSHSKNSKNAKRNSAKKGKSKKMKKNKHPVRTFFKVLITIIILLVIVLNILLISYISKVKKIERGQRTITNASIKSPNVRNVLVIGSDTRNPKDRGRTDTIILLSINRETKQITMTSFMRDMYVNIKGRNDNGENVDTWGKINSAYTYGGAELLMDTLELNFDISIDDYVYFGFDSFIDIVNAVGGVEISVTDEEAQGMQPQTMEINDILHRKHTADVLTKGGKYNMNGYQALAYARLRYVGNADFQRTERQREVIGKIIEKVKKNPLLLNKLGNSAAENISTNMSTGELYILFYKCLFSMGYDINSLRLPAENSYQYGNHDGQSTLDVDFNACQTLIKERVYSGINEDDDTL